MSDKKLPKLGDEYLYIPFVGAIIEREYEGKSQIVVQIRYKDSDPLYSGAIEIPGGKFRAHEDVYETLKREVLEECGLTLTSIRGEDRRISYSNREDHSDLLQPFCITQMIEGPFIGMIFICEAEGKLLKETNETKEARWMDISELKDIIEKSPEKIYTAFFAPLKKYLENK